MKKSHAKEDAPWGEKPGEKIKWMKSGQWFSLGAGEGEKPWGEGETWAVVLEVSSFFLLFFLSFFSARDSVTFIFLW